MKKTLLLLSALLLVTTWQVSAAWYETKGQAVVFNGDKQLAKQRATEEAIKQAMLFAGASVQSVQTLSNGLLSTDSVEILAGGEINHLELVDEKWHNDYVTVTIRANILPQAQTCGAANFNKTIITTYFPVSHQQQLADGQIQAVSHALPMRLKAHMSANSHQVMIKAVAPYAAHWNAYDVQRQASGLAAQYQAQFVLTAVIEDISVHRPSHSSLKFWKDGAAKRQLGLKTSLIDGINGAVLFEKIYTTEAPWEFDRFSNVDVFSDHFWNSAFGTEVSNLLTTLTTDIEMQLVCRPATGRVIAVANNQLQISLGRSQGLKVGDTLSVYQLQEVTDSFGMSYLQYNLHAQRVKVVSAYADNAVVESIDKGLLTHIQPNDFVAKK